MYTQTERELDENVAKARGMTGEMEEGYWPNIEEVWRDNRGMKVSSNGPPRISYEPKQWGEFMDVLRKEGCRITLTTHTIGTRNVVTIMLSNNQSLGVGVSDEIGIALGMAYLNMRCLPLPKSMEKL